MQMRNSKVAIKQSPKDTHQNQLFKMPTNNESVGVVKYSQQDDLPEGQKVVFSNQYTKLYVNGEELLIMDESNVVALLEK